MINRAVSIVVPVGVESDVERLVENRSSGLGRRRTERAVLSVLGARQVMVERR